MQVDPGVEPVFAGMMSDPQYADIAQEFLDRTYFKSVRRETTHTTHPTIAVPFSGDNCTACAPFKDQFLVEHPPAKGTRRRGGNRVIDLGAESANVIHHKPNTRSTKKRKR